MNQHDAPATEDPFAYTGQPRLGLRNYWYPALASWRLRKKPKSVRMLGEDIVLFRDGGKLHALANRCAHRGGSLSMGKCLYPGSGTISCPYHGWTYKGDTGQVVAKLVEGPNAHIPAQARVKPYPVREFRSMRPTCTAPRPNCCGSRSSRTRPTTPPSRSKMARASAIAQRAA